MKFIRQIKQEVKMLTNTKFIFAVACGLLLFSILYPFLDKIIYGIVDYQHEPRTISIGGINVSDDNPVFYNLETLEELMKSLETDSSKYTKDEQVKRLALTLVDESIEYYVKVAMAIENYDDYRYEIKDSYFHFLNTQRLLEANKSDLARLRSALEIVFAENYLSDEDFNKVYINISTTQRTERINLCKKYVEDINFILENKGHPDTFDKYFNIIIYQLQSNNEKLLDSIAVLEKEIIEHPASETQNAGIIKDYNRDIQMNNAYKEMYEYMREYHIDPSSEDWRIQALYKRNH